jgi:hypothetical protein
MERDPTIYVRHILEAIANSETDIPLGQLLLVRFWRARRGKRAGS